MGQRGGHHLLTQLLCLHQKWLLRSEFVIRAVDCLSACSHPCTVAFAAPNKATLMFGDLQPLASAVDVLKLGEQYFASADGIVPRQERPKVLKQGILARIPPLPGAN